MIMAYHNPLGYRQQIGGAACVSPPIPQPAATPAVARLQFTARASFMLFSGRRLKKAYLLYSLNSPLLVLRDLAPVDLRHYEG